jgi:hypothetical protein
LYLLRFIISSDQDTYSRYANFGRKRRLTGHVNKFLFAHSFIKSSHLRLQKFRQNA